MTKIIAKDGDDDDYNLMTMDDVPTGTQFLLRLSFDYYHYSHHSSSSSMSSEAAISKAKEVLETVKAKATEVAKKFHDDLEQNEMLRVSRIVLGPL